MLYAMNDPSFTASVEGPDGTFVMGGDGAWKNDYIAFNTAGALDTKFGTNGLGRRQVRG